jgi:hypothetical protein
MPGGAKDPVIIFQAHGLTGPGYLQPEAQINGRDILRIETLDPIDPRRDPKQITGFQPVLLLRQIHIHMPLQQQPHQVALKVVPALHIQLHGLMPPGKSPQAQP